MQSLGSEAWLRLAVVFGSFFVVAVWEIAQPRRSEEFDFRGRWLGNLTVYVVNAAILVWLFPEPASVRGPFQAATGIPLPSWPFANAACSLVCGLLFFDLLRYGVHRLQHWVPLLWRFHALHHSDPDVDVTTGLRHHPIEIVVATAMLWTMCFLVDLPTWVALVYGLVASATATLQHGNIRLPAVLERRLQPVFVTADIHRIHHSIVWAQGNSNYGAVFSIWDRLFKTFTRLSAGAHDNIVFGIEALRSREHQTLPAMLASPWRMMRASA
jgi:sterol desaturase/sphingolipid hydroxylase (fatty acid hydroxylase superfamily)